MYHTATPKPAASSARTATPPAPPVPSSAPSRPLSGRGRRGKNERLYNNFSATGRTAVGTLIVGNPGLGVLNVHRPNVCNDSGCSHLIRVYRRTNTTRNFSRIRIFRSGRRNDVISGVRRTCKGISNVIVGPTTCARADITVLSTLGTITVPTIRIRVDTIRAHRSFHRIDCTHLTYFTAVAKRNLGNCTRTLRLLGRRLRGWGTGPGGRRQLTHTQLRRRAE